MKKIIDVALELLQNFFTLCFIAIAFLVPACVIVGLVLLLKVLLGGI